MLIEYNRIFPILYDIWKKTHLGSSGAFNFHIVANATEKNLLPNVINSLVDFKVL